MTAPTVAVVGLKALNRDIRRLCDDRGDLYKALSAAGRQAAEPVAAVARSSYPQVSGRLAGDVRVTASKSGAAVRVGRSNLRYAGWVDFGGTRRVPHVSSRDFQPRGRYLFPAAIQMASEAARLYSDGVTQALVSFGWTNSGDTVRD